MDWPTAVVLAAVLAVVPIMRHLRYRRQVLLEVRLRNFLVPAPLPRPLTADADAAAALAVPDRAVLYVDAAGRCTLADDAARALLRWNGGELSLADVVGGGVPEAAELLATLARNGAIEARPTRLRIPPDLPVDLSAVAVRDRDDNLWGAAFFISGPRTPAPAA
jgi:hypothetical protein